MGNCTLVMVNWSQRKVMELALRSFAKYHCYDMPTKLLLIDNGSFDDSKEWLKENEIPFIDFAVNIGHENALNILYSQIQTKYALICDTDVEFLCNVFSAYMRFFENGECKLIGDYITGDNLGSPVKPRVGAWFMLTDVAAMKEKGINYFRKATDWSYDVGSEYAENVLNNGFTIHHIPRLNSDINNDVKGMDYGSHVHYGKLSWNLNNHWDREWEVKMRMSYIIDQRLPLYQDVQLKGKFV